MESKKENLDICQEGRLNINWVMGILEKLLQSIEISAFLKKLLHI